MSDKYFVREEQLIVRVLDELRAATEAGWTRFLADVSARHYGVWAKLVATAGTLDALLSLAALAQLPGYCRPAILTEPVGGGPLLRVWGVASTLAVGKVERGGTPHHSRRRAGWREVHRRYAPRPGRHQGTTRMQRLQSQQLPAGIGLHPWHVQHSARSTASIGHQGRVC